MIELEMLAIAWACQKIRIFTEGLPRKLFEVWTDHAPFVPILEKQALPDIDNKQLQRLKMKVDHLTLRLYGSRARITSKQIPFLVTHVPKLTQDDINVVQGHLLELNVLHAQDGHIFDEILCKLRDFGNEDADYKMTIKHVINGFPKDAINIPDTLMPR
jgi:hypothetical protein